LSGTKLTTKMGIKNWPACAGRITKFIVLALVCLLIGAAGVNLAFAESNPPSSVTCATYFTYIGCPNCAHTDPIVLTEWTKKYPNLVVIEYGWQAGDWQDPNSRFFGDFAQKYKTQAAVPQLVFDRKNIRLGRVDVPQGEKDIKALSSNPCPLIDKNIFWEDIDLNRLEARPKIWANGRILIKKGDGWLFQWNGETLSKNLIGREKIDNGLAKSLLFSHNISKAIKGRNFAIAKPEKAKFSGSAFPDLEVAPYAEFENAIKIKISKKPSSAGAPSPTLKPTKKQSAEEGPIEEEVKIPFWGKIKTEQFSLPALTLLLGLADGFNPCAFFTLTFLLAALIGLAGTRKKILLVGSIFVFFSALLYFLFMSVLLNVFQLGEKISVLTLIAGGVAVFAGVINIKDYFFFQKGISLTLPKSHKEKFLRRVKNLSLAKSTWALSTATAVIAATVNIYELLCTFGFPMVYTRILTLRKLPSLKYYLYLISYNLIYVFPLTAIVLIFAITMGGKTFSQIWVRRLKLVSGFMILILGSILVLKPKLLESIFTAFGVLVGATIISGLIIFIDSFHRKRNKK